MKITTYEEAKTYLESLAKPTIFRKIELKAAAAKNPLDRMYRLLALLDNPQKEFKAIQVSGTSGKGSTAYLIAHILTIAGYNTGFSMSPHLVKINERIQVNMVPVSDEEFVSLINDIQPCIRQMAEEGEEPSYFEITMAMSFLFFAKKKVDFGIVEVGIEGNYDASNTVDPLVSVLTNVDLDHTDILGDTVEAIAKEAVSVIREPAQIAVTGVKQESVIAIVEQRAKEEEIPLLLLGKDFICEQRASQNNRPLFDYFDSEGEIRRLALNMMGDYQIENAALAIKTIRSIPDITIAEATIRTALSSAFLPGRFEEIELKTKDSKLKIILDGAHNPAKMQAFITSLAFLYPTKKKIFIVGFKSNKDVASMLSQISTVANTIVVTKYSVSPDYQGPVGAEVKDLEHQLVPMAVNKNVAVFSEPTVSQALEKAMTLMKDDNIVVVTGSLYLVGEVKQLLEK